MSKALQIFVVLLAVSVATFGAGLPAVAAGKADLIGSMP